MFNEVKIKAYDNFIIVSIKDSLFVFFIGAVFLVVAFSYFYKLPFCVSGVILSISFILTLKKNEVIFYKYEKKVVKRSRLLGIKIGKTSEFNFNENELFFDGAVLIDASVGQTKYYSLNIIGKEEQILLFRDKSTVEEIEHALLSNGIISNKLPKYNIV